MTERSGQDRQPFIVDNGGSDSTAMDCLERWTGDSRFLDIATGYFDVGALLRLDGRWQKLEKIRLLLGAPTNHRTRRALLDAVRQKEVEVLDASIEEDKEKNPLLRGVSKVLEAFRTGRIECRAYDRAKFHAKAYITHSKQQPASGHALVGSSNFTKAGLTENVELNLRIHRDPEVAQLQTWFERYWNAATDVAETVVEAIERHVRLYTPFLEAHSSYHRIPRRPRSRSRKGLLV